MWFGDLVTMPWFDDVWLKEVFANLMAEKILAGRDTDARARLRLYVSHYPAAYDVDRTDGAHPIRQPLDNLARASELYGPIAYQKSPIAFRNLERRMGEGPFRAAVRDYLHRHAWSCAGWPELLAICERVHGRALGAWSRQWIEMAGRPDIVLSADWAAEDYGHVVLDPPGARVLLDSIGADDGHAGGPDAAHRAASWMALWDAVCDGALPPGRFATALLERVPREGEPLLRDWLTTLLRRVFWRWLTDDERRGLAPEVEQMCRTALASSRDPVERRAWLGRLRGLTSSPAGTDWLHSVWLARRCHDDGLDPHDEIALAETLCVLDDARASEVLAVQSDRLVDAAARARLDYLAPALRSGVAGHSAVVAGFAAPGRRHPEAWTLDALTWIHHPLRRRDAARLIEPCLQLLPEVQAAGDIFVPRRWAHAVLQGYSGADAVDAVERALALDTLTAFHRRLVLEAADDLLRVTRRGRYARAGGAAGAVVNDEGSGA
jgi:aminopeptidase N